MATFEEFLNAVSLKSALKLNVQVLARDPFVKFQFNGANGDLANDRLIKEIIKERVVDYTLCHDDVGYFYPQLYIGKLPIPKIGYCLGAVCHMTILPGTCGLTIDHPAFYRQPITAKYAFVPSVYCDNSKLLLARLRDTHDIQDDSILKNLERLKEEHPPTMYHKIVMFAKTFKCGYDPDSFDPIEIPVYEDHRIHYSGSKALDGSQDDHDAAAQNYYN